MKHFFKKLTALLILSWTMSLATPTVGHTFTMTKRETRVLLAATSLFWGPFVIGRWAKEHPIKATIAAATLAASTYTGKKFYEGHVESRNLRSAQIALMARDHTAKTDQIVQETCEKYGVVIPKNLDSEANRLDAYQTIEHELKR